MYMTKNKKTRQVTMVDQRHHNTIKNEGKRSERSSWMIFAWMTILVIVIAVFLSALFATEDENNNNNNNNIKNALSNLRADPFLMTATTNKKDEESNEGTKKHNVDDTMGHGKSEVVATPCGLIEYAVEGPSDGTPIMISHGLLGGYDHGIHCGKEFAKRGFYVIAPSRFGYLQTPASPDDDVSLPRSAALFTCLMNALHLDTIALVGISIGSVPSALEFAHLFPDRIHALILMAPSGIEPPNGPRLPLGVSSQALLHLLGALGVFNYDLLYRLVREVAPQWLITTALATPWDVYKNASDRDKQYADEWLDLFLPLGPRQEGHIVDMVHLKDASILGDLLDDMHTPTLTIGCQDAGFGVYDVADTIANRVENGHFVGYPTGGHLGLGHLDEVRDEISDFVHKTADKHNLEEMVYDWFLD